MQKYKKQKAYLSEVILRQAYLSVYISFDLWTSSSNSTYVNVICHFDDVNKRLRTLLLAIRHIQGDHDGKNQTKFILSILMKYSLKEKLGYFITDNASSNDICVMQIVETLRLDLNISNQRFQYMGHIINSIAKALLFSNKSETFEADLAIAEGVRDIEGAMRLWKR